MEVKSYYFVKMIMIEKQVFATKLSRWQHAEAGLETTHEFEDIIEFMEAQLVTDFNLGVDSERG